MGLYQINAFAFTFSVNDYYVSCYQLGSIASAVQSGYLITWPKVQWHCQVCYCGWFNSGDCMVSFVVCCFHLCLGQPLIKCMSLPHLKQLLPLMAFMSQFEIASDFEFSPKSSALIFCFWSSWIAWQKISFEFLIWNDLSLFLT